MVAWMPVIEARPSDRRPEWREDRSNEVIKTGVAAGKA